MDLHPLHRLYQGLGHGETGALASWAAASVPAPAAPKPHVTATTAAVAGLTALAVVSRLIAKATGAR